MLLVFSYSKKYFCMKLTQGCIEYYVEPGTISRFLLHLSNPMTRTKQQQP